MRRWWLVGVAVVCASILLLIAMQALAGHWLPPISLSQYGIGPWGWVFSLWAISIALGPLCLQHSMAQDNRLSQVLLVGGLVGGVLMAIVRTQAGGDQVTWNAKVHMAGSIAASALVPLGMLAALWPLRGRARWGAVVLTAAVAVALGLLLAAAAGVDTAGMGPPRSWAFWQMIASVAAELQMLWMALHTSSRVTADRHRGPPVTADRGA